MIQQIDSDLEKTKNANAGSFFRPIKQGLLLFILCLTVLALLLAVYSARWIILATLIGVGLGVIFQPIMDFLQSRMNVPRALGAIFFFMVSLAILIGISWVLFLVVSEQLIPLAFNLPRYLDAAQNKVLSLAQDRPWLKSQVESLNIIGAVNSALQTLFHTLHLGLIALAGFFFVITVSLYFSMSANQYRDSILSLFPSYMRDRIREIFHNSGKTLRQWTIAQGITMLCVGGATALGLRIIGIDYWLAFGIFAGLLDIIPYLGPILAGMCILVVTLGSHPDKFFWVLGTFFAIQQMESNLIVPLVMKGQIELPPIYLMALMLIMGSWFGILGVFAAPPLFAIGRTVFLMTYIPKMDLKKRPLSEEVAQPPPPRDKRPPAA